jgi:hypothetical protein
LGRAAAHFSQRDDALRRATTSVELNYQRTRLVNGITESLCDDFGVDEAGGGVIHFCVATVKE